VAREHQRLQLVHDRELGIGERGGHGHSQRHIHLRYFGTRLERLEVAPVAPTPGLRTASTPMSSPLPTGH
jgi:hypothetical protein